MKKLIYILLSLALLTFFGCIFLFKSVEDKYLISKIELRKVQLIQVGENLKVVNYSASNEFVRSGIGITLTKKFVSDEESPKQLIFTSQEPGINGLLNSRQLDSIGIYLGGTAIMENIFCFNINTQDPEDLNFNGEGVSFNEVVKMMKNNDRTLSGIRLNKVEKYFWISDEDSTTIELMKFKDLKSNK